MKLTKFTIQNFKGIQYLDIKDFQCVNLLVGRNNCGKTSVLEAISMSSPQNIYFLRNIGFHDLSKSIAHKELQEIILFLKEIEPNIEPVNLLGNGTRRFLMIVSAIFNAKDNILLIDEIEYGFHYSSLKTLWKAVFRAAQDFNVQIFATTHSYECIEAFANLKFPEIALYRIDRTDGKHQAFFYSAEVLRAGVEKEFEIR